MKYIQHSLSPAYGSLYSPFPPTPFPPLPHRQFPPARIAPRPPRRRRPQPQPPHHPLAHRVTRLPALLALAPLALDDGGDLVGRNGEGLDSEVAAEGRDDLRGGKEVRDGGEEEGPVKEEELEGGRKEVGPA